MRAWLPEAGVSTLLGKAHRTTSSGERFFVPSWPSLDHVLVDAGGRQHVVLRTDGASLQLMIEGTDVTARPVAINFLVQGVAAIRKACDQLRLLDRILSQDGTPSPPRVHWTPRTRNLRDALITVDGRQAGASHREIATVIHGAADVAAHWGAGLRQRMQRNYSRGEALAAGGWRDLLR